MTDNDRYVYVRKNGEPSRAVGLRTVMDAVHMRLEGSGGMVDYRLRRNEGPAGPARSLHETEMKLRQRLSNASIGDRYRVYSEAEEGPLFKVHKVQPGLVVVDISGNAHADYYYSKILTVFPQYKPRYAGSYVCKDIAGSSTLSQHSYGNAVDFFFDSLEHQDLVASFVVANQVELNVATDGHVISRQRIYENGAWQAYSGEYHSHLHVDFDPQFTGSCGVREP